LEEVREGEKEEGGEGEKGVGRSVGRSGGRVEGGRGERRWREVKINFIPVAKLKIQAFLPWLAKIFTRAASMEANHGTWLGSGSL
jgi:hypothetical protein